MKNFFFILLLLVFVSNYSFSQEPWSTVKPPMGKYVKLPQNIVHWENPNKTPMIYYTPNGVISVAANFRVLPNTNQQDEIYLSSNPAWPMLLYGASNSTATGNVYSQGVYVSTNGGVNWYGTDVMPNCPIGASDPAPAIDRYGNFVFTTLNTSGSVSMIGMYSTNYGVNWSTPFTIPGGSPSDKNLTGTDDVPSSPYYGRTYTVWSKTSGTWPIMVSYTTNSGVSWSAGTQINTPTTTSQGCDVVVGPGGVVYVCWSNQASVSTGVGFAKSTNGGVSWTVTNSAYSSGGIRDNSNFNGWGVRVNDFPRIACDKSGGARNGWIYIVDPQKNLSPAGTDPDVILHRSTDGGASWSAGIRVNQDALNNGKVQFFPAVCVDGGGGVNVIYYDNRNYPSVADSCETYVSRSIDGGTTWTDIRVSDHRWKPQGEPGLAPYMGDYIGITAGNGKIWPFWFDNKSGSFQAWTAPIDLGPSIIHTPLGNTEQISGTIPVNCTITPAGSGINPGLTQLNYRKAPVTTWTAVNMTNSSGTNWTANLTLSGAGTYNYYITTTDSLARTATAPPGAPAIYYSFTSSTDTVKPVIVHTPIGNTPKQSWPVTVTANVTDNIGVDSAWVRWYKNNTTTTKTFKLINTTGSTYTAPFNSLNSDVNPGDSIFYRIIAQDNSSNHNRDSTALLKFAITSVVTTNVCRTVWVPIRDLQTSYDSFQVGTHSSIIKINFTMVQLVHTWDGDVTFALRSPTGTEVVLSASHGGSGDNYINTVFNDSGTTPIASGTPPFTGTFTPDNPLSAFNGQDPFGWWRLRVYDGAGGDTGHIGQYCTQIFAGAIITNVGNNEKIPTKYALNQNYPNPFNPVTRISFDIPKQGLVSIKIYDVLGREVRILFNEVKAAGSYAVDFNASEFASGVYFYRLESNGFSDIKKMMLIK